jgi:predicted Zn-dependent protease
LIRINEQNSIEPFTGQVTFAADRRHRRQAINQQAASLFDAQTGGIKPAYLAQALKSVAAAVAADPENPALRRVSMELHVVHGDHAAGLAAMDALIPLLPASDSLSVGRAKLLVQLGRTAEARPILQAVADREVGTSEALEALIKLDLEIGDTGRAIELLKARLERDPTNASLPVTLAGLLVQSGDTAGAATILHDLLAQHPESTEALHLLCQLYAQTGRAESIPELCRSAAPSQPRNVENNTYLADFYEAKGDRANTALYLQALADSGDATADQLVRLAMAQLDLGRREDVPVALWQARRVAEAAGDSAAVARISELFERYDTPSVN